MKEWIKRNKWLLILGSIIAFGIIASAASNPSNSTVTPTVIPVAPTTLYQNNQQIPQEPILSNNNYYINSVGNSVHSPAFSNDNSIPSSASARCRDGTYSFSQSRRGTCSHHGGVATWL